MRGPEAGGLEYFDDDTTFRAQNPSMFFYNEARCHSWACQEVKNRYFTIFMPVLHFLTTFP